ncbi:hypothetical protein DERP_001509 [Dermatophagoides pteronyssinus]|uniref:Uncharacterized protein n=1 Tax=Dermatophagoides pteronyssinus TaxID=6956 RepID=A0ABQ8JF60_DERPT|nr:hypothetical protein DERP_001509 [Dermatophagoides pteronyssinus]
MIVMEQSNMSITYFPMDPVIKACYGERLKWLAGKEQTQVAKCCSQALLLIPKNAVIYPIVWDFGRIFYI